MAKVIGDAARRQMEELDKMSARQIYTISEEMWKLRSATYMENWPEELFAISIASRRVDMTVRETRMFGRLMMELGEGFDELDASKEQIEEFRKVLEARLDGAVKSFDRGAFVRLGSRSPKDSMGWGMDPEDNEKGTVFNGHQALWRLTGCSERMYEDTQTYLSRDLPAPIFVREWIDIPIWSEYRCWWRNGKLIAISQYYYFERFEEVVDSWRDVQYYIEQFAKNVFASVIHLPSVVFDVFVINGDVTLLEINPYWGRTDPCLFNWQEISDIPEGSSIIPFKIVEEQPKLGSLD